MNQFIQVANILNALNSDNGRNFKKDILENHKQNSDLKLIFRLAYDPYIKFNITRVQSNPEPKRTIEEYDMDKFLSDLDKLVEKQITGNDALDHVEFIFNSLPEEFRPYLEKILQKDLKIGVSTSTINEIWPDWIPEFKLGLCERWKKIKDLRFPYYAEPKIDGVRVIAHVIPALQKVEMISRSGLGYKNFKVIEEELLKSDFGNIFFDNERIMKSGIVLDGEIIDKDFQGIMNNARRIYDVDCPNAKFHVWDMIYGDEFFKEECSTPLDERKTGLDLVLFPHEGHIKVLYWEMAESYADVIRIFENYYDQGYEGVILKAPKSHYIYSSGSKRGKVWIKYKIQDYNKENAGISEYTVKITGYYPGEKNTKYKDALGGFTYTGIGELKDGTSVTINGRVGGGYKDVQRFDFWERREQLVGSFVDVESQEVTTNKEGTHSLRFPVFKRFRDDLIKESSN